MTWTKVAVCAMCDADLCCAKCGREQPDDGKAQDWIDRLCFALSTGVMSTEAWPGEKPFIKLRFDALGDMQDAHAALLGLLVFEHCIGASEPDVGAETGTRAT